MTDDSWRMPAFRQSVVAKIEETIRNAAINTSRNSIEMETHVFQKAKNKEEYLGFVARLILHVREMNTKKNNEIEGPDQAQGGPGMPDPINALQNLASRGSRNQMMNMRNQPNQMGGAQQPNAANLLQTINRGPGQQMMFGNMPVQGAPPMAQNAGPIGNQMGQQMSHQMSEQMPIQLQNPNVIQLPNQMQNQMMNQMGNHMTCINMHANRGNQMMAAISLNTPGQPIQSPMGHIDQKEQAYRQLSKYIEPLRKMIARMGNEGKDVEKINKLNKLLEILSNPQQRLPLDTLLKCEVFLEKLEFKNEDSSVPTTSTTHLPFQDLNPLLEADSNNLNIPIINHTEIELASSFKKLLIEEPTDVLQGEIARLNKRFKVYLDQNQQPGSKIIQLTCTLDDKFLPCVPPLFLTIPEDYPKTAPTCHIAANEYNATQFSSTVRIVLLARIKKLPTPFSVTQLLYNWEMSARQASNMCYIQRDKLLYQPLCQN